MACCEKKFQEYRKISVVVLSLKLDVSASLQYMLEYQYIGFNVIEEMDVLERGGQAGKKQKHPYSISLN